MGIRLASERRSGHQENLWYYDGCFQEIILRIRAKFIAIVLPLIVAGICLSGISSAAIARNAITRVAARFMSFKSDQLSNYLQSQWNILIENGLESRRDMLDAAQAGAEAYARTLLLSDTEVVLALDASGEVAMSTSDVELAPGEARALLAGATGGIVPLATRSVGGQRRAVRGFAFEPFGWTVFVTEAEDVFYGDVAYITGRTAAITAAACAAAVALLLVLVRLITRPLAGTAAAMRAIISSNDLSARVGVEYRDEIGEMSQTFNVMTAELEKAYGRIKNYAFQAVVAEKREKKVRHIFQKYVPQELIDKFFANPEAMLVGENRSLSILFSDIRGFTSISEGLAPDVLVAGLNRYFSVMVDIIMGRGGMVDKYIGDAIMAIFGAPVAHDDDPLASTLAGLEMVESLGRFNEEQRKAALPEFNIGVGINYGTVTVGNIGTDRKMDYTVIGDMVNVASRLEGLTKLYHQRVIVSQALRDEVGDGLRFRIIDSVAVKGRRGGIRIYAPRKESSPEAEKAFALHDRSMELYYARDFASAASLFREVGSLLPGDYLAPMMIERCERLSAAPPPDDWDGVEVMESK
jgi:adenylate cyclase